MKKWLLFTPIFTSRLHTKQTYSMKKIYFKNGIIVQVSDEIAKIIGNKAAAGAQGFHFIVDENDNPILLINFSEIVYMMWPHGSTIKNRSRPVNLQSRCNHVGVIDKDSMVVIIWFSIK